MVAGLASCTPCWRANERARAGCQIACDRNLYGLLQGVSKACYAACIERTMVECADGGSFPAEK